MTLTLDVFNSGYLPVNGGPGWDPGHAATWPASTATLIAGERDAMLVDALMTIDEGHQLASWIGEAGKNLTSIVITHGHGDHFFGAGPVLTAFPATRLLALNTSFVAQEIALIRPDVVLRLVLASSAPRGGAGMHGWAPEVINAVGQPQPDPKG